MTLKTVRKTLLGAAAVLAATATLALPALAADKEAPPGFTGVEVNDGRPLWRQETIDLFASLPVQDGGRVKPLSTFAGFTLLKLYGSRSYRTTDGTSRSPTEFVMDCLFFAEAAGRQKVFRVRNDEVLDAAGLSHEGKKKSDKYSFEELAPAAGKIAQLGAQCHRIDLKDRTPVQAQTVLLAESLSQYQALTGYLAFAGRKYAVDGSPALAALFEGTEETGLADILPRATAIRELGTGGHAHGGDAEADEGSDGAAVDQLLQALTEGARSAQTLALIPPSGDTDTPNWMTPWDVVLSAFGRKASIERQIALVGGLEAMAAARDDMATFHARAQAFHDTVTQLAEERGEYAKIPLEVTYYKAQFFFYALILFVLGFVAAGLSWMWPRSRWLARSVPLPVVVGLLLVSTGITYRCIIRGRPPVSTLYETILFISAIAVLAALVMEYINRRRIAVAAASVFGALGMFLAYKYEIHEAVDTMPSLVAVLDTNFWLATHVTTITIGYAGGLFAGLVAHVWLLGKLLGLKRGDTDFYQSVARMTYGLLCFCLLFSVVGTVLGGIWANYSWGRFWGWDPKENGALLICLWGIAVLHARKGRYIRDRGVAMSAVFGGMIVAFSWWGVNLLGIGLHSYGFTSGVMLNLLIFYGIETLVLLAATVHWLVTRGAPRRLGTAPPPLPPAA